MSLWWRLWGSYSSLASETVLLTPEFRTCRNYYSEESEAELTIETERPVFFLFPFLERGSGAGGRVYSTLACRPVSRPKIAVTHGSPRYREKGPS